MTGINVPIAYTQAYTCFGLACVVAARVPNNAGSLLPLTVSAPYFLVEIASTLRSAENHHEIIQRFGRFPHRNRTLGRECSPAPPV